MPGLRVSGQTLPVRDGAGHRAARRVVGIIVVGAVVVMVVGLTTDSDVAVAVVAALIAIATFIVLKLDGSGP